MDVSVQVEHRVKILTLELKNFMGFEAQTFTFDPCFNLLVGPNGSGKSATLRALGIALEPWIGHLSPIETESTKPSSVMRLRAIGNGFSVSLEFQAPVEIVESGSYDSQPFRIAIQSGSRDSFDITEGLENLLVQGPFQKKLLQDELFDVLPICSIYGTNRCHQTRDSAANESIRDTENPTRGQSRFDSYVGCLSPSIEFKSLEQLFVREALFTAANKDWPTGTAVKQSLLRCIPDARDIRFDPERYELLVDVGNQGLLPINNLSDGQRSVFAMVGDIAQRMARLNPHLGSNVLTETPGIVIIDELDLHLHPSWQRTIVNSLKESFPKVQFFVSTHSPQIIGEVPSSQIIVLTPEGPKRPTASFGVDSNDILEYIQGASSRDTNIAKLIDAIQDQLMEFNLKEADRLLEQLRHESEQPNRATVALETELYNARALVEDALIDRK